MKTGGLSRAEIRSLSQALYRYNKNLRSTVRELVVYEVSSELRLYIGLENPIILRM